ncbi:hypothetical protein GOACH_16_00440 [Gordonia aichiensis NBRC 108223]|uniref:Uncharacterized protein n=1 Tax=Gordonia aichiensis NBRC 108223 TaxID=1220583 RepID=L7KPM9_9ACTN|nr:hypothetical protein GOACH_16_00440 [Gordonia aichiensis NBRC 108223]
MWRELWTASEAMSDPHATEVSAERTCRWGCLVSPTEGIGGAHRRREEGKPPGGLHIPKVSTH